MANIVIIHRDFPRVNERWYFPSDKLGMVMAGVIMDRRAAEFWHKVHESADYVKLYFDHEPSEQDVRESLAKTLENEK